MSEENVEVVREMVEAWNRRDHAAAREKISPEVEVEVSAGTDLDGTYRGYAGLAEMLKFWGAFAEFHSKIEEALSTGEEVVVNVHHYGRGKASGAEVEMHQWQVFTLRDARIVRYRIYGSREKALEAAGLSED